MLHKPSFKWYRLRKKEIGYEMCYRNNINSLQLEDHLGRGIPGFDKTCKLFKKKDEDLEHSLVRCPDLNQKRNKEIMKQRIPMTSEEQTLHILFKSKQYQEVGKMIRNMWEYRKHRKGRLKPP